jgi:hypothetical protein
MILSEFYKISVKGENGSLECIRDIEKLLEV